MSTLSSSMLSSKLCKRAPCLAVAHSGEVVCVHAQLGVHSTLGTCSEIADVPEEPLQPAQLDAHILHKCSAAGRQCHARACARLLRPDGGAQAAARPGDMRPAS